MPVVENHVDKWINIIIRSQNDDEKRKHKSSGKLSASMLGKPLQWQILKVKGVGGSDVDDYTLRKFLRGKHVEQWIVSMMPGVSSTQDFVEYRGCIGYVDAICSTQNYNQPCGRIPHEIKSVSNEKFKRIKTQGGADRSHILQACLYALATGASHFAVVYVASDDYRILTYVYKASEYKKEVDSIIDKFNEAISKDIIPVFEPVEKWQSNKKYNDYPSWSDLTFEQLQDKYKQFINSKEENSNVQ